MKPKFLEAISDGDILTIRLYLANEMMLDPRGKSFDKMRTYAEINVDSLYQTHDGTDFSEYSSLWDEELLFNLRNELDSNFSKERLDFFAKVAQVVLKEKAECINAEKKAILKADNSIQDSEECSPETKSKSKSFKNRILTTVKRKLKDKTTAPLNESLTKEN